MVEKLLNKKIVFGTLTALILLSALGINYAAGVDGPQVRELSLQEAVELALRNNPDMEIAKLAVDKAEVEYEGAKDAADDWEVENVQTYELGLLKWVKPKATEVALSIAEKNRELAEKSLKFSVENAYYNVLKAEKNLAVKREGLKYFQDQLKIAETAYKIGTKARVDVTTIEAAAAAYQAQVASEENAYRTAVMELNRITGLDLDTPLKLTTRFAVEKIGSSVKLDETIAEALADNIEMLTVKKTLELKQVEYDVAKKFYGGGVTVYDTAKIEAQSAEAKLRKQELATRSVVRQSYLTLLALEKMVDWQAKEVEKARENYRIFVLKYEAGLATSLDVKKATIDLEQAEANLSDTIYRYNLLKSQFKYRLFSTTAAGQAAGSAGAASGGPGSSGSSS